MIDEGLLKPDDSQRQGALILESLLPDHDRMSAWSKQSRPEPVDPDKQTDEESETEQEPPKVTVQGAYLHGPVGSGKSLLMDLFAAECSAFLGEGQLSRRCHFHEFMLEIHAHLHRLQAPRGP